MEVACTLPNSQPSNVRTLTLMGIILSTITDILYCMIDTSRIVEKERYKAQSEVVKKVIEEEIYTVEGHANWCCTMVIRGARNMEHIRVAYRDEAELQWVKK